MCIPRLLLSSDEMFILYSRELISAIYAPFIETYGSHCKWNIINKKTGYIFSFYPCQFPIFVDNYLYVVKNITCSSHLMAFKSTINILLNCQQSDIALKQKWKSERGPSCSPCKNKFMTVEDLKKKVQINEKRIYGSCTYSYQHMDIIR